MGYRRLFASLFLLLAALATPPAHAIRLAPLGADPARVSVSGLSSGAFMAVQYGVAFSASTTGVGVVAGGPYNCAYVNIGGIFTCMMGTPSGAASYNAALGFDVLDQIDPVANIARQKIYLFSGTKDTVVHQPVMNAVRDFYQAAKVPAANLRYLSSFAAGHAFISDLVGNACDVTGKPYVDQCTDAGTLYDQPHAILEYIYGTLQPEATTLSAKPVPFDQRPFTGANLGGMADTGYLYVPAACKRGVAPACAVHVVFHGCTQSADEIGDVVYAKLGYNPWADTNRIIILYPQVDRSSLVPFNPQGCWDWWGYSGLTFQTKGGAQLAAIKAMVDKLTSR